MGMAVRVMGRIQTEQKHAVAGISGIRWISFGINRLYHLPGSNYITGFTKGTGMAECIISAILSRIHIGKQLLINPLGIQQVFPKLCLILYLRINSKLIQVTGKVRHPHDGSWLLNLQCRTENSFFLLREPLNPAG